MMNDLMFKATDKAAWDAFAATFPAADILIDEIGPIVITPAVIAPDGTVVTPAVVDPLFHVNIRVQRTVIQEGDQEVNVCPELAQGGAGVDWIDPAEVASPDRIWAGGMNYWMPEQVD